ncbi:hypothetical protein psyc5s11_17440 [Clostridium gelidum]|uniref:Carbohydrate kinase PfkB domain-containing protein n=1 Tax=Clostridium gelidum TaxID=704125 RepID=A0ABN6IYX2_9CLOT|nr:hypothetical protein [Clostridium gelidum]BCZ45677.1 hypothetical protein psyc5s11_17440 [Clostridium gelidum]
MFDKCKLVSIANLGQTDAVEFLDGKLMIGKREALRDVNWDKLKETVGIEIGDILEVSEGFSKVDLETLTTEIAKRLNVYCTVVHPVREAAAVCNGKYFHTWCPFEPNPKLTTGAGDNFNAGFCLG